MNSLPDIERNLFNAGIDAIEVGIEDMASPIRARKVAAIRNFYTGILLLCKHHLTRHAPPCHNRNHSNALIALVSTLTLEHEPRRMACQ